MADQKTCGVCDKPCSTCFGEPTKCTSCDQNSSLPLLYGSVCVASCPITATNVAGVCEDCKTPCKTCSGSSTICTSCDAIDGKDLIVG
jgi:proprotein convertase subtilisin/kexin type 5